MDGPLYRRLADVRRGRHARRWRRASAGQGAALRLPHRRVELRPGTGHRPVLQHRQQRDVRGAARIRIPRQPSAHAAQHGRGPARGVERFQDLHLPHPAGHLLHRRPRLQGPAPRARRAGLRLQPQAPLRPALEERAAVPARRRQGPRPVGATQPAPGRQDALRLRPRGRRPEGVGPLQLSHPSGRTHAALQPAHGAGWRCRCAGARSRRTLWRQHRRTPCGHGAVSPRRMEAQLAHRAGAQRCLSRCLLRRASRGGRCALTGRGRAIQGPQAADGRPCRGRHHRRGAATLAELSQRRTRPAGQPARRVRREGDPERPPRPQPRQARHGHGALPALRCLGELLRDGERCCRRLRAAQGGAAPRHRAGGGRRARDPPRAPRPGHPGAKHHRAADLRLRPQVQVRDERVQPRAGQGTARPARLRRQGWRRLARSARWLATAA